jgi:acyl-CoA thioesterase FadM
VAAHVHTARFLVVMSEVDVAQIHFTAVHRWMDRGLSEWLVEVGHPFTRLLEEGPGIPIVETTEIGGVGRTSFRSRHVFSRAGEVMARGELIHVCVDRRTRETVPVPGWLRDAAVPDPVDVPKDGTI